MTREKRRLDPSDGDEEQQKQKLPAFGSGFLCSVIAEALKVDSLQKLGSSLEPTLRRAVSEEVERALAKLGAAKISGRSSPKQTEKPDGRSLQLHFRSRLSLPLYTGGKVEGENGTAIHVELIDANTGLCVTSGPESSAKLLLVALEGDFNNEDNKDWSQKDFESHVVKEREGKGPLLTGVLRVSLNEGVGIVGDLSFTDNSSWLRSKKFRLGLKVAPGFLEGVRILEAITAAFTVRDRRGELYKKHYPPAFNDDVWRLENIRKDGSFHKTLNEAGIFTVEGFRRHIVMDSHRLRTILGKGMSNGMWKDLVKHAETCHLSGQFYVYYADDTRNIGVVFNSNYKLFGLISGGQYYSAETLSDSQKVFVDTLVKRAYDNWTHIIEYDGRSLLNPKQSRGASSSRNEVLVGPSDYVPTMDQEVSLPHLQMLVPPEQASVHPSLTVLGCIGYNEIPTSNYASHSHHSNAQIQFESPLFALQNQTVSSSQQTQITRNDNSVGLVVGLQQSSSLGFQSICPFVQQSNPTSYDDCSHHHNNSADESFSDEEIRMMMATDEELKLLPIFSMGGAHVNVTKDGYSYPPNYSFHEDRGRSSSIAVIGWLKVKASVQWGIFIRKKVVKRRAQLFELNDYSG